MEIKNKADKLKNIIASYGKLAIAFSGGVDSSVLLATAINVLGKENVMALICESDFAIPSVKKMAKEVVSDLGVPLNVINIDIFAYDKIIANNSDRCYHCKYLIFDTFLTYGKNFGFDILADGTNYDDDDNERPGTKAKNELGVVSPLKEAGLTKNDIRQLAVELSLKNAEMPSNSCLATRIECGKSITKEVLKQISRAEDELHALYDFSRLRVKYIKDKIVVEIAAADKEFFNNNLSDILDILIDIFDDLPIDFAVNG